MHDSTDPRPVQRRRRNLAIRVRGRSRNEWWAAMTLASSSFFVWCGLSIGLNLLFGGDPAWIMSLVLGAIAAGATVGARWHEPRPDRSDHR